MVACWDLPTSSSIVQPSMDAAAGLTKVIRPSMPRPCTPSPIASRMASTTLPVALGFVPRVAGNDEMFVRSLLDCACGTTTHSSEIGIDPPSEHRTEARLQPLDDTHRNHMS